MTFVHLHVQSEFSLQESGARIPELVKKAKDLGFDSLALTDRQAMHGAVRFYEACKAEGIKPIAGVKLAFRMKENGAEYDLLFLAENNQGYRSLLSLVTRASEKERSTYATLEDLRTLENVFVIQPMDRGPVQTLLLDKDLYGAEEVQDALTNVLSDRVYIEVQNHWYREEREKLLALKSWMKDREVKLVGSNRVLAVEEKDTDVCSVLTSIRTGTPLAELGTAGESEGYYLKSEQEMKDALEGWEEALHNAAVLAERCTWELELGDITLPRYSEIDDAGVLLRSWCENGMYERFGQPDQAAWERLEHEVSIIESMQFADYFLIVADFMQFAHKEGITTGPGRGSAAGSLVAYVLKITNVDPLAYNLLFERFLNPQRVSMPDIDIDFADADRDKVIHYVAERYGKEHVAQIVTFGTFAAKAAVRDAGKALGSDPYDIDRLAKLIPSRPNTKIADAEKLSSVQKLIEQKPDIGNVVHAAKKLEGLPRHTSVHAAGIVMSRRPLPEVVPLQQGHEGLMLTQYPMGDLEKLGLLKMDFLGLRNLTLIDRITKLASIDLTKIRFDDDIVFALLGRGDTFGIFQLESQGMQRVLKQLRPNSFEDIVAVNALYRPGPMEFIPTYVARKHGEEEISYIHADLEPILKPTYGVLIYQEQIMQIASLMAGFTLGEADILRRAVSKKKRDALEEGRVQFVKGAESKGYRREEAEEVYSQIARFADYGFNRSHAVAYSVISYQLAYLKARTPEAFYTALMESAVHDQEKLAFLIHEAGTHSLKVLPPSVQAGEAGFKLENRNIRLGLTSVKFVNEKSAQAVAESRGEEPFRDLFDFCGRLPKHIRTRRLLEALILSGALDDFKKSRTILLASLDTALEYAEQEDKKTEQGEELFPDEVIHPDYAEVKPMARTEELKLEKEMLGCYLSGHPLEEQAETLQKYKRLPIMEALKKSHKENVRIAGLITQIRTIETKKGDEMAFLQIEDESGGADVTVFPKPFKKYQLQFIKNEKLFIEGLIEEYEGERKIILQKCVLVDSLIDREKQQNASALYLYITIQAEKQALEEVKELLENTPGEVPVVLKYASDGKIVRLSEMWNVAVNEAFLEKLQARLGKNHVVFRKPGV
ncbi:DNA polymerase III subunit alpha [Alkalicoccus halolimnae]|uniref:DNA polymerase III subunit alpha n=1 Tax=Alkalicoccus halolimnae TaxID=1667239 RepID=A0A5C7F4Z5_9BACI|nr:DNA polymerase III subunit alpha [Alkalicoccus halolimnae]TXF85731.1 DNA polymerase III subunit alpha [Alkalicoccus halolimnae]